MPRQFCTRSKSLSPHSDRLFPLFAFAHSAHSLPSGSARRQPIRTDLKRMAATTVNPSKDSSQRGQSLMVNGQAETP